MLCVLGNGEDSPMENHGKFEIASDNKNKRYYVYDVLVRTTGKRSIDEICLIYIDKYESQKAG